MSLWMRNAFNLEMEMKVPTHFRRSKKNPEFIWQVKEALGEELMATLKDYSKAHGLLIW